MAANAEMEEAKDGMGKQSISNMDANTVGPNGVVSESTRMDT